MIFFVNANAKRPSPRSNPKSRAANCSGKMVPFVVLEILFGQRLTVRNNPAACCKFHPLSFFFSFYLQISAQKARGQGNSDTRASNRNSSRSIVPANVFPAVLTVIFSTSKHSRLQAYLCPTHCFCCCHCIFICTKVGPPKSAGFAWSKCQ